VRRLLLVNALIFAVLAAAVALAYYGYSYATEASSRERELELMHDLAEEKVVSIESLILRDDDKLFASPLPLEPFIAKLNDLASSVHLVSVFVLDEQLKVIPDGFKSSRRDKEAVEFRDWFEKSVAPTLGLEKLEPNVREHLHGISAGAPYLFSFVKKVSGGRTYYIVIEEDLDYLVLYLFRQFFPNREDRESYDSKRLYQVVDERGEIVYGLPFRYDTDAPSVSVPFVATVDGWSVLVSEANDKVRKALERKRLVDSLFIGGAITVILVGLVFLALAIRRERRANELKSEFISNVSHELKTPLSIISMFGEMLANGRTKGPEQATEYADIIWRESVRLGRLIDNVLDFAKIERGKGGYEFAEADVADVVERAVDLVGRRLATAEMSISVEISPELPHVELDGNAFTLAVMNLIDNAVKYAAEGKRIELTLSRGIPMGGKPNDEERLLLRVRDFGPGIDPEEQDQIFERFYRARAVRLKPIRGSGIGLALVRHIARAHGGDIGVKSELGKGTTFELWLPIP
jgi:two-component system, OmpR family, phosphate regulon sensor histidine kinase PhoR